MALIAEVLDIQRSYSTQVDLQEEYYDAERREERMAHYKPIKAHRSAFEKIAEGIYQQSSKRSFILSGSYGTGKSHLLLMAASYFSSPSSTNEMEEFFKNYALAEEEEGISDKKALRLKNLRNEGRYLVCICDYASLDFETNLLRAISKTLEKEGFDMESLDSYYKQAAKKIREWQNADNTYFIDTMEQLLENKESKWTVDSMLTDIENYDVDALNRFKQLHKQITTNKFSYDSDNYVEIIRQMIKTKQIEDKYAGILILFDEFDYQVNEKRFHLEQFQKFLQMCSKSLLDGFPIIFIATIHKSFLDYRSVYNAKDFSTLSDRFDEIVLKSEGIEDIITAVVNPMKTCDLWTSVIQPRQSELVLLSNDTNKLKLFDWLSAPKVKTKIIENVYSMHPAATYALIKLAGSAGSNNRSVVSFFSSESREKGTFTEFIHTTEILENGDLSLYTVDRLFEYFSLTSDNGDVSDFAREHLRNYESSLRELMKIRHNDLTDIILTSDVFEKLLRVMVIYDIIGQPNNYELIKFGMNMTKASKASSLENAIKIACEKKIIYLNDTNNCYEFKRSDSKDISGLIRDYKSNPNHILENHVDTLFEVSKSDFAVKIKKFFKDEYVLPQKYNLLYLEDKRFKKKFSILKDIEDTTFFYNVNMTIVQDAGWKDSYEGVIVYVVCDTDDEREKAVRALKKNTYSNIVITIANEPAKMFEDVFSLKAACDIQNSATDFTSQDKIALKQQAQEYDTRIEKRLKYITDSKNYQAYSANGELLASGANDEAVVVVMEKHYFKKRNAFRHDEINKSHEFKEVNTALRDAVDRLLDLTQQIYYRSDYGNDRGDIKYIKNVLIQNSVVYQTNTSGQAVYCDLEQEYEKYGNVIPALVAMIKEVKDNKNGNINVQNFVIKYQRNYGLGLNALLLYLAVVKRYFKDSLSFVKDINSVGTITVNNMDILKKIVMDSNYSGCVMQYEPISKYEEDMVNKFAIIFGGTNSSSLDDLHGLLRQWYSSLNTINKVPAIYESEETRKFIALCNKLDSASIRELCLYELKEVFGHDRDELIIDGLVDEFSDKCKKQKEIIENGYIGVRHDILYGISALFGEETDDVTKISSLASAWASGLDDAQKDILNPLQSDESKPLVKIVTSDNSIAELLLSTIPSDMKFGAVKNWLSDKSKEYIAAFAKGKKHLEEEVFSVTVPEVDFNGKDIRKEGTDNRNTKIKFSGELSITFNLGTDNICFFVTTDGTEPNSINSQREKRLEAYSLKIRNDSTIKICGMNQENKYSNVATISCFNEDTKYEVKLDGYQQFQHFDTDGLRENRDIKVTTIVPIDSESLSLCIKSLTNRMRQNHNVSNDEIITGLKKVISDMEG